MNPQRSDRAILFTVGVCAAAALLAGTGTARAGWDQISRLLSLQGKPEPASANVLSEHEIEGLDAASPQDQAELLLERSINHFVGTNEQIAARVRGWRGRITLTSRLDSLFRTAINSDDLRVRAAGIEVDIAARNLEKTSATVDGLEPVARTGEQDLRANALWDLGLIGNRGVAPDRIERIISSSLHDPNENIRYWAVEGLAYLGTDAVIEPLLDVFRDDPSGKIRERAACSLAQSGMLNEQQRYTAVPRLLDYTEDGSLDAETRTWVYQALRDITGQTLPHEGAAWRQWYASRKGRPAEREPQ
ncbi:MAG: HEAT repeat domain-containing protein [Acidobacteriota bacterium]